jgi:signal transduction histidine kinase
VFRSPPMRRRAPAVAAVVVGAIACILALLTSYGPGWLVAASNSNVGFGVGIFICLAVAFSLALLLPWWAALVGAVVFVAALQVSAGGFNPLLIAAPGAAWVAGLILRDRSRLSGELERTGRRLRAETALLAEESVRYERARIARELHDIVAHCVSVMVVQAYAGERLLQGEPDRAAASFDNILDAVSQAKLELHRLVELLDEDGAGVPVRPLGAALGELRDRVAAAGLIVGLRIRGDVDDLPRPMSGAVFRTVQEGVTNALKHAPGAPISIEVERSPDRLRAVVTNGLATPVTDPREPALRRSGGGYGLEGMRGRLEALGGTLAAGPDAGGGWAVEALVPVAPASLTSIAPVAARSEAHHRAPVHGNMNTNAERPRRPSRFAPGSGRVRADAAQPGGPTPPR